MNERTNERMNCRQATVNMLMVQHKLTHSSLIIVRYASTVGVVLTGDFEDTLQSLIGDCHNQNVPCVFALGRKALGRVCAKPVPVSLVGILSCAGVQVPPALAIQLVVFTYDNICKMSSLTGVSDKPTVTVK